MSKLAFLIKQNIQNSNACIEIEAIERSIQLVQREQKSLVEDVTSTTGRIRELITAELNKLGKDVEKLQQEKELALPAAKNWEAYQKELDIFFTWCEEARNHYEEAPHAKKRIALKMLGAEVYIYTENDSAHPRYEISLRVFLPTIECS